MNQIIIRQTVYQDDSFDNFKAAWYQSQLHYLASDLLETGLSPSDITTAVRKAIVACKMAGEDVQKHFQPIYTQRHDGVVQDCKLSKTGYGLVLLNADTSNEVVAKWQLALLNR